ncbi:polysaccharide deacetylase family protein [Streptomyces cadmiisoli]|uniref:Ribulose phosphate epimerase n=1 Tax=Streptomyces cadmiisoli TaxID=2184053 RepID=A0A2Z4JES1_9ACTN|nr:polysaccharide deacetylase [Streptomyces cadmiisoli]AWW43491.1 ribulose phosphate epimerase [Streptomyces cadmiisoli]
MNPDTNSSPTLALTFDVDTEEVWLAEDPRNATRPVLLSQGGYEMRRGLPEVLRLLRSNEVTGTFFVPGRVAERHPDAVRAIADDGHEVACHGYTHRSPADLPLDEETEELTRALAAFDRLGIQVSGYRSPSWELSASSLGILEKAGIRYSSNFMDDVVPYIHPGTRIVELPVHWALDDAAHFWFSNESWSKKISTNSEVEEIWTDELLGIASIGGCCILTLHPQIIGRPGRLRLLERFIARAREVPGLRLATCADIAASTLPSEEGPRS